MMLLGGGTSRNVLATMKGIGKSTWSCFETKWDTGRGGVLMVQSKESGRF